VATQKKSKSWPEIGTIRVGETKETKEKYTYIKLKDNVEIYVNGEKVELNAGRTLRLERPTDKVEQLMERGIIDEAEGDKRLEKLAEMPWLKYSIVAPPPRS
jgi:hypothetical protein